MVPIKYADRKTFSTTTKQKKAAHWTAVKNEALSLLPYRIDDRLRRLLDSG